MTTSWLLWCGAGSGALHLAVYQAQRRIHHGPDTPGGLPFAAVVAAYVLATCGLFALYSAVLLLCRRGWITTPRNRRLVIGIPVVFNLALVGTLPTLSIDVYSYLAHGYVQAGLRQNPYLIGARTVAGTSFGREIADYGWRPVHPVSPYGPVLTHLEHAVVAATRNVRAQIVLIKAVAVTAALASAALIWLLLGRVAPQVQLLGTVVFLWNPMVIWELAGEGHNDAVMFVFMLAAMALILCERHIGGITALALAILTKYVPVLVVPLFAAYAWRTTPRRGRLLVRAGVGVTLAAAVTIILFLPLWAGLDTFSGVRLNGAPGTTGSTPTVILEALDRLGPLANWQGIVWLLVLFASCICPVLTASCVTDAPGLLRATAVVWLWYLLVISPTYWPWYATTAVALLALAPERRFITMAIVVSFSARLAAPLVMLYVHELISRPVFLGSVWIIGSGVPLLMLAVNGSALAREKWSFRGRHLAARRRTIG